MRTCTTAITFLALQVALAGVAFGVHAPAPFDAAQWTVKKSITADFGPTLRNATVSLLVSKEPTGTGALVEPIYTANLIVTVRETVVYRFFQRPLAVGGDSKSLVLLPPTPTRTALDCEATFMDDILELKDVTGDGVPEIIFHTGCTYADGFSRALHVLHYVGTGTDHATFRDIGASKFREGDYQRVSWFTYAGHPLMIVAEEREPKFGTPEERCYQCGRQHNYRVYEWDRRRQRMVRHATIPHTTKVHGDEDPFEEDRGYILERLRLLYGLRRPRSASSVTGGWPLRIDFDPTQWDTVKTLTANVGRTLPRATVQLLVSREAVSHDVNPDGSEHSQYHMVNLVVRSDEHVIYQYCWLPLTYHYERYAEGFFKDAELELRDVTNDGIPEILFRSWNAISPPELHVLRYDTSPTAVEPFHDIFPHTWDRETFTWFDVAGRTLALVAVAEKTNNRRPSSTMAHHYDVYEWSNPRQAFTHRNTVASTGQLHDSGTDPFTVDAEYLRTELARRYSPTPAPAHPRSRSGAPTNGTSPARAHP